eukprot:gene12482-13765_t
MAVVGDWQSMAGRMGFKYGEVLNFNRRSDPTSAVLRQWSEDQGSEATVTELMKILRDIKRNDAVALLKKHEFTQSAVECDFSASDKDRAEESHDMRYVLASLATFA